MQISDIRLTASELCHSLSNASLSQEECRLEVDQGVLPHWLSRNSHSQKLFVTASGGACTQMVSMRGSTALVN